MHLLATTTATLDQAIEPVDLAQAPAATLALSFSDSDLAGLAAAWKEHELDLPSLRLAALRDLRHPMSVDLWIDKTARHAAAIVVRLLGGYEWWAYGCEQLGALAREKRIALALLPGECRERDERLAALSTVSESDYTALLACFRDGGPGNMGLALRRLARLANCEISIETSVPPPKAGFYVPGIGAVGEDHFVGLAETGWPVVPILFYRSALLARDAAPIDALAAALGERSIAAMPIFVPSLRDAAARAVIEAAVRRFRPKLLLTATAFASGAEPGVETLFDTLGMPVFQVAMAGTRREAWASGQRGLAPADLAMHVVLPELDGRVMAGAVSFKGRSELDAALGLALQHNRPEPDRIAQVAERVAAFLRLQHTPRAARKIALLVPDYPAATGRTGYAVGLDVPGSVLAILHDLRDAGYSVENIPAEPRDLMRLLEPERPALPLAAYREALEQLPAQALEAVSSAWGEPDRESGSEQKFGFRHIAFGNVTVALAPDRGRSAERRSDYHDPALPPRHALLAFGVWLRESLNVHALLHLGAHGTLEWLPGKTVALSENCFPELVAGALPVVYPFIVSNPGEAAQAKRRIAAVTLGHLTPPFAAAELTDEQRELERLVDEYAQADGLDRRRRDRLAGLILQKAAETGLLAEAGASAEAPGDALARIDAWLCDLKDFAVKDGLHIYGRAGEGDDPLRLQSAQAEKQALLDALDGRHIRPGPSGAPARGRTDVLPTGRNLCTADPRTLPTPTAVSLGKAAADEVVETYVQSHGEYPRALVLDLWGSASLRTGGEEIAQGLALMGCRPQWDSSSGRVLGIEVLPPAMLGHPRVDVTWRISGLFRDMFPTQIALLDAAARAIAERDEADDENPLAAARRRSGRTPPRVFGSAPGTYGSGIEEKLASGDWESREELGQAYLDATSHAFGGAEGEGVSAPGAFAAQVEEADLLVHGADDPGRDILEGSADVAFAGGFAAAVAALGGHADVIVLDSTDPHRPKARSLASAITRTVRARALNHRFIEGQLRHGPRGAAEFAETVDRLVGFAETTEGVPGALLDAVHAAYVEDFRVRAFLLHENPAAARAIAERFSSARRRGLWHPRRNSVDDDLAALIREARGLEAA